MNLNYNPGKITFSRPLSLSLLVVSDRNRNNGVNERLIQTNARSCFGRIILSDKRHSSSMYNKMYVWKEKDAIWNLMYETID